jgi:hypothetical protein
VGLYSDALTPKEKDALSVLYVNTAAFQPVQNLVFVENVAIFIEPRHRINSLRNYTLPYGEPIIPPRGLM